MKGFPSLVAELKFIYSDKGKALVFGDLLHDYLEGKIDGFKKDPTVDLWVLFFLACHYDRLRNLSKAMEYIEKAIAHTPTQVDLYTMKARIVKHCGDLKQAAEVYNYARELDEADRYLNAKCAKYYLRMGDRDEAQKQMKAFVKDPMSGLLNCHEMQCMWWECELGEAARLQGDLLEAYKNFAQVEQHFRHFKEDQYEFHNYCLRKNQINVYIDMQEWQMRLRANPFFIKAIPPLFKVIDGIQRNPEVYQALLTKNKAEVDKTEEAINKARGDDEWRRPDRDPKGFVMLKTVLTNHALIDKMRVGLARDLI